MDNSLEKQIRKIVNELKVFKLGLDALNSETSVINSVSRPDIPMKELEEIVKKVSDIWFQKV